MRTTLTITQTLSVIKFSMETVKRKQTLYVIEFSTWMIKHKQPLDIICCFMRIALTFRQTLYVIEFSTGTIKRKQTLFVIEFSTWTVKRKQPWTKYVAAWKKSIRMLVKIFRRNLSIHDPASVDGNYRYLLQKCDRKNNKIWETNYWFS